MTLAPSKKLYLLIFSFLFLSGAVFAIWEIFLNRGTLILTAKEPYMVTLIKENSSTPSAGKAPYLEKLCNANPCSVKVIPGDYTLSISKENYQTESRQIKIPLLGRYEEKINFRFLPTLKPLGKYNIFILPPAAETFRKNLLAISLQFKALPAAELKNLPSRIADLIFAPDGKTALVFEEDKISLYQIAKATLTELALPSKARLFYDQQGSTFAYIDRNNQNFRQTLYLQGIDAQGQLKQPVMVTSFIRDLQNYSLKISPNGSKIVLIDGEDTKATLYLIDLTTKNRINLFSASYLAAVRWFPDGDDFLFEARNLDTLNSSIYHYRANLQSIKKLDLSGPLSHIIAIDKERLIALKLQHVPTSVTTEDLEGKIIDGNSMTDSTITKESLLKNGEMELLAFIDYSLISDQGKVLKAIFNQALPEVIELANDRRSLYLLQGGQLFQFRFNDEGDGD